MVVDEDQCRGVAENRGLKDFPRVNQRCGERANGDDIEAEDVILAVEEERDEHLAVELAELFAERFVDLAGVPDSSQPTVALPALTDHLELIHEKPRRRAVGDLPPESSPAWQSSPGEATSLGGSLRTLLVLGGGEL